MRPYARKSVGCLERGTPFGLYGCTRTGRSHFQGYAAVSVVRVLFMLVKLLCLLSLLRSYFRRKAGRFSPKVLDSAGIVPPTPSPVRRWAFSTMGCPPHIPLGKESKTIDSKTCAQLFRTRSHTVKPLLGKARNVSACNISKAGKVPSQILLENLKQFS